MLFMTRKRLEEEKAKAIREFEERMWQTDRINNIEKDLHYQLCELREKVRRLEMKTDNQEFDENANMCGCGTTPVPPTRG